jgi:hypothetical protein
MHLPAPTVLGEREGRKRLINAGNRIYSEAEITGCDSVKKFIPFTSRETLEWSIAALTVAHQNIVGGTRDLDTRLIRTKRTLNKHNGQIGHWSPITSGQKVHTGVNV